MEDLHIGIIGATGRLGTKIKQLCQKKTSISSKTTIEEIAFEKVDVFIDVSAPNIIQKFIPYLILHKKPLVIGSTGHSSKCLQAINEASLKIPILIAPNFSKGIFLLKKLLKELAIDPAYITETHHLDKKDKPSGTAKLLSSLFSKAPPIHSIREKDAIGTHSISYKLPFEELEITHKAQSLHLFAKGAIDASSFLYEKEKGIYTMDNVYKEGLNE